MGTKSTANDGEKLGIALALERNTHYDNIRICADSRNALKTTWDINKGSPRKSGIERRIKKGLQPCEPKHAKAHPTRARAHIGIKGNERAGQAANEYSDITRLPNTATPGGIKAISKERRKEWRTEHTYGESRSDWNRKVLAGYTWARTDGGPQNTWLHKIGKAASPTCPRCGQQDPGHHLTFICPAWDTIRKKLIGDRTQWGDLDKPIWIGAGAGEGVFDGSHTAFWFFSRFLPLIVFFAPNANFFRTSS